MNKKLEPCPFCGAEANVVVDLIVDDYEDDDEFDELLEKSQKTYAVKCEKCSCGTPFFVSLEPAIKLWNRRAKDE